MRLSAYLNAYIIQPSPLIVFLAEIPHKENNSFPFFTQLFYFGSFSAVVAITDFPNGLYEFI